MSLRRIRFLVTGRVQGVAFRATTRDAARRTGVSGFVRNRADGAVEGEAQGRDRAVSAFVAFLWEGSPWARVDELGIEDLAVLGGEAGFEIRR